METGDGTNGKTTSGKANRQKTWGGRPPVACFSLSECACSITEATRRQTPDDVSETEAGEGSAYCTMKTLIKEKDDEGEVKLQTETGSILGLASLRVDGHLPTPRKPSTSSSLPSLKGAHPSPCNFPPIPPAQATPTPRPAGTGRRRRPRS